MEVGDGLLRQQRAKRRGVFDLLTLRGFLDRQYDDPARGRRTSPTRLREMYKMYSNEAAAQSSSAFSRYQPRATCASPSFGASASALSLAASASA